MIKKKIAIIGTNGIPANYGGFETLAENLVKNLSEAFDITVYCASGKYKTKPKNVYGARLIYLPFKANGLQSLLYDFISQIHAWFTADVLLVLGPAAGITLPLNVLFRKKLVVNHGGLNEWEREKLSWVQKKFVLLNHKLTAMSASVNIADNEILQNSLNSKFKANSIVIKYGGDHVRSVPYTNSYLEKYPYLSSPYVVSVSRAQVDNNLHLLLQAFESYSKIKLVLVSNFDVSEYGKNLWDQYQNNSNIILQKAIYNPDELNLVRGNAKLYIHSHSRCGTAPSLVEAMWLGLPIISYDVPTNRLTTKDQSIYFNSSDSLLNIIENLNDAKVSELGGKMKTIAENEYSWKRISNQYESLFLNSK